MENKDIVLKVKIRRLCLRFEKRKKLRKLLPLKMSMKWRKMMKKLSINNLSCDERDFAFQDLTNLILFVMPLENVN